MADDINYTVNRQISAKQFIELLRATTLGERRPLDDSSCMQGMLDNANLCITAWQNDTLVGIARSVTDFHYACYLSDLAVHQDFQSLGIGRKLLAVTFEQLQPPCKLILISAPAANDYYAHIGFTQNPRCWIMENT